ncbi:hypothetical protein [uncultured Campylobacter sp.]|uniref:hypothetical protein n=1 Tax=uncultured Campylobacter sp. TaxID=218934 RepID=UPI002628FD3E|nr:hypothetical protein [uncultured Campylobacter sp.]
MQDLVSQVRKEGMISTGIDLFLAAVLAVFKVIGLASGGMFLIVSGIFITLICFSVIYRLRVLRKISMLSGIKAAALYRNCVMICICFVALLLFYPAGCYREVTIKEMIEETIWNLAVPATAIYIIVAWLRINFSLARVSGVMIFRIYVWLCAFFFALNWLCGAGPFGLATSKPQIGDTVAALVITSFKEFLPFASLIITSVVHLLAWSKIEKLA